MPDEIGSEFQYVVKCLDSLAQKRYREAMETLGDGLRYQLQASKEVDGRLLLKHMNTVVSYLEHRLAEDLGFSLDDRVNHSEVQVNRRCSFCGMDEKQERLIAGPAVSICADCIERCAVLIE